VTSRQFKRWLASQGCTFQSTKSSHLKVFRGHYAAVLPMHGGDKQLGGGLVHRIKKQLGLK
jgi:mRNA interferase HicA